VENGLRGVRRNTGGRRVAAEELLRLALESKVTQEAVWSEVYKIEEVLKDLTNTQVKTAKELRLTATTEQVTYLISGIQSAIIDAVNRFIDDPTVQFNVLQHVSARITRLSNIGSSAVGIPTFATAVKTEETPSQWIERHFYVPDPRDPITGEQFPPVLFAYPIYKNV